MAKQVKLLIGLIAVLLLVWLDHGPLRSGARFIDALGGEAEQVVAQTGLQGIEVRMARQPLARVATLSGPANDFQRYGMGSFKGITQRVADIRGIASVRWADERGNNHFTLPLLAEILGLASLAYLTGVALALIIVRRRRRDRYA